MKKSITFIIVSLMTSSATLVAAENPQAIEQRLNKLERLVNSNGLVDMMVRLESIQSEMQRMQGELEVQKHALDEIKKRQRDLYLDIDRRLLLLERRNGNAESPSAQNLSQSTEETNVTAAVPSNSGVDNTSVQSNSSPVQSSAKDAKSTNKANELKDYENALDLLKASRYEKAKQALRKFVADYPDGRYAHIAQFWLAEASYYTRQFSAAIKDYQNLIDRYPNSPKRASALFKIAYSHYELKDISRSTAVLEQLIQAYPGTTEAGQAQNLLQKIRLQKSR